MRAFSRSNIKSFLSPCQMPGEELTQLGAVSLAKQRSLLDVFSVKLVVYNSVTRVVVQECTGLRLSPPEYTASLKPFNKAA